MSKKVRQIITLLFMGALSLHFVFILNYTLCPARDPESLLDRCSYNYSYPYFHQSWKLFVPYPRTNYHVYARARRDSSWTPWADLFAETVAAHQKNRVMGYELRLLALSSSVNYLENFLPAQTSFATAPSDPNFAVFARQLKQMLSQRYKHIDRYEAMVYYDEPGNKRAYYFKNLH